AMAGGVAVPVAGRTGGAALGDAPTRGETLPHRAGQQQRVRLGRSADAGHRFVGYRKQRMPRRVGIDHGAADEVRRGAGYRQQRRREQPSRRRFGHGDRLAPPFQQAGRAFRQRKQLVHLDLAVQQVSGPSYPLAPSYSPTDNSERQDTRLPVPPAAPPQRNETANQIAGATG